MLPYASTSPVTELRRRSHCTDQEVFPRGAAEARPRLTVTMDTSTSLIIGVVTGAFGMAYFVYGKKQQQFVPLVAGIALCVYPYFVDNLVASLMIGAVLLAAPFIIRA